MNNTIEDSNVQNHADYEQASYGKLAYKRVQRLRRKGQRRGIEVPYLGYSLTKPEKPRLVFWIIAAVSVAVFIGILVAIGFLYNALITAFSDLDGIGEFLKVMFDPSVLTASFGWSALPGIMMAAVYLLIAILFILPIIAAGYFYCFVRDSFYMAVCSKEEFAKGSLISSRIVRSATILIVLTVIFIMLISIVNAPSAKLYMGLIYGGLALVLGGLIAVTVMEKIKCGRWFESLDAYKKQNYLEHERALRRIKSRLNTEKRLWSDLGK